MKTGPRSIVHEMVVVMVVVVVTQINTFWAQGDIATMGVMASDCRHGLYINLLLHKISKR